jgi:hypothetical protein
MIYYWFTADVTSFYVYDRKEKNILGSSSFTFILFTTP